MDLFEKERAWMALAACAGMDPNLFFPDRYDDKDWTAIKKLCAGCPVKDECRDYAVRHHEGAGWWGGMSPKDRRRYAFRQAQAAMRREQGWY